MDNASAKREWLARVLDVELAPAATGGPTGRPTDRGVGPLVAFRQSLLRWREAQQTLEANLASLGQRVLAHPEVQADPRRAQIEQAVGQIGRTVPAFGDGLADLLDAGLNAAESTEQARLSGEAMRLIDKYQQQLAAAQPLLQLEQFASKQLSADMPLHGALSTALNDIRRHLAA